MSSFGCNQTIISKEQSPNRTLLLFELRGVCVCVYVSVYTHRKQRHLVILISDFLKYFLTLI